MPSGRLSWLNAGHPLPLLVRHGHVRELVCRPSLPMGLGGTVEEIAIEQLQPGDRVLFYTDGAVESRSPTRKPFGVPRLIDHLAVAVQEGAAPAETVRRCQRRSSPTTVRRWATKRPSCCSSSTAGGCGETTFAG